MPRQLSEACFGDRCRDCGWPECGCSCHADQEWLWEKGWRDKPGEPEPEPEVEILTWDWKEQPDLDDLARIVHDVSGCRLHLYKVDTGSDQYALVVARKPIGAEAAHRAYMADYYGGEDQIPPEAKAFLDGFRAGLGEEVETDAD